MEDARRFVSGPVGVHVGAVSEQELGDLEMLVHNRPGKRHVDHLLHLGEARTDVAMVTARIAECRLALIIEAAL